MNDIFFDVLEFADELEMLFACQVVEEDIELLAETQTLTNAIKVCHEVVAVNDSLA